MAYWNAHSDFDAFPAIAGYVDCNGNQFESYDDACRYYGVDTPAQVEAEERYWAAEEAREEALRLDNDALIYDADGARYYLELAERGIAARVATRAAIDPDLDDECPF